MGPVFWNQTKVNRPVMELQKPKPLWCHPARVVFNIGMKSFYRYSSDFTADKLEEECLHRKKNVCKTRRLSALNDPSAFIKGIDIKLWSIKRGGGESFVQSVLCLCEVEGATSTWWIIMLFSGPLPFPAHTVTLYYFILFSSFPVLMT